MVKPTLQPVDREATTNTAPVDPFAPENLQLSQSFTEMVGVKKLLTTIPVRKPGPQDFVRVIPAPSIETISRSLSWKDRREDRHYRSRTELAGELAHQDLVSSGSTDGYSLFLASAASVLRRQGSGLVAFGAPRLPGLAMKVWVRVKPNMNLGAYDVFQAEGVMSEPEWPQSVTGI